MQSFAVSQEALLQILEALPDAVLLIDDQTTLLYANQRAQALIGATTEEMSGTSLGCCAPQLMTPELYQEIQRSIQTGEPHNLAYFAPALSTSLQASLTPTDAGLTLVLREAPASLQDISGLYEQNHRALLESFSDGVTLLTPEGLILDINQRPLSDARLQREQVLGTPFTELPAWSSDPVVQQRLRLAIARASRGETVNFEARIHPRADLFLDILMTITAHRDDHQRIAYLVCAGRDITERKRIEDELHALVDAIPHMVWIMSPEGASEYNNRRWYDYMNIDALDDPETDWLQTIHPEDRAYTLAQWLQALSTGEAFENEARIKNGHTGVYRWFLTRALPMRNEAGQIIKWIGTSTDITGQKQAEQQLKISREHLRVLAETVPQMVWTTRAEDGLSDYFNQRFYDYTQSSQEQLYGYGWCQFLHPDDRERTLTARKRALSTGTPYEVEYRLREGQSGRYRWFLARALPVYDDTGQILKWFGTATDIDEQRRAGERKDTFISMASHELRNPLTALKLQTSMLHRQLARQSILDQVPSLTRMEDQIHKVIRLVEELLDVSKIQAGQLEYRRESVDLTALLREVVETQQQTSTRHRILLQSITSASTIGDRDRLGQVFTNLLSNAIKYSPDAETVEVEISTSPERVHILVRDHGIGIPDEQLDRIFERFFRVAHSGQQAIPGMGIGLYIVAEIVRHHGGTIAVESTFGRGSTFTVSLPLQPETGTLPS